MPSTSRAAKCRRTAIAGVTGEGAGWTGVSGNGTVADRMGSGAELRSRLGG